MLKIVELKPLLETKELSMIKKIAVATTVAVLVFSGCGEDRSHPMDGNSTITVYANPVAVIEVNASTHQYVEALDQYTIDRAHINNPFIFDGIRSHDLDENNQSIVRHAWNVTTSLSETCVDINITGNVARVAYNVERNATLCTGQALTYGQEINVTLTVTDDEGAKATTIKNIKTN